MNQVNAVPFVRLILPFCAGIIASAYVDEDLSFPTCFFFVGLGFLLVLSRIRFNYRWRWVFGISLHIMLFLAGIYRSLAFNELGQSSHFRAGLPSYHYFVAQVSHAPSKGKKVKTPVRIELAGAEVQHLQAVTGNMLLFTDSLPGAPLRYGDRILFQATVSPARQSMNPDAFAYDAYLHRRNIHFTAFVNPDSIRILENRSGNPVWQLAFDCRDRVLQILQQHFVRSAGEMSVYAVAAALMLGYQDDLPDELSRAYAETGSMHALAVSGSHVGVLYIGILFLLQRLPLRGRRGQLTESMLALLVIWSFTFITGASASVMRASAMFSLYLLGKMLYREANKWNLLAASAFVLLLYNPWYLYDAGFQLSYAAVTGMALFYPPLRGISLYRLPSWTDQPVQVLLFGVSAQLGALPLSLYYFQQFPVYFWLAGWVVLLGGSVFLGLGALLILAHYVMPPIAEIAGDVLYWLARLLNWLILHVQQLPGALVEGIWVGHGAVWLLYACLLALAMALASRQGKWLIVFFALLTVAGLYRNVRKLPQLNQQKTVIYCLNRASLIDFFDGMTVISLQDSLDEKAERYAATSHRWAMGMRNQVKIHPDTAMQIGAFSARPPLVQLGDQKMALINGDGDIRGAAVTPVDYIILTGNPRVQIRDCLAVFPARKIIWDTSNSRYRAEKWRNECRELGVPYWDVREHGAWQSANSE